MRLGRRSAYGEADRPVNYLNNLHRISGDHGVAVVCLLVIRTEYGITFGSPQRDDVAVTVDDN